jgi:hypothetical protein
MKTAFKKNAQEFPMVEKISNRKEYQEKIESIQELYHYQFTNGTVRQSFSNYKFLKFNSNQFQLDDENIFKISEMSSLLRDEKNVISLFFLIERMKTFPLN